MKRLFSVSAFTALLTLIRMIAGFVVVKVVAIYTGPSGVAMLGQVQSLVTSLNGIVTAPAGNGLVRFTAQYSPKGYAYCAPWWRTSFYFVIISLLVIIPLAISFSNALSQWLFGDSCYYWIIVSCVLALPFSALGTMVYSVTNGQQQYRRYVFLGMISVAISSTFMLVFIFFGNLKGALIAGATQNGLIGAVLLLLSIREPWFKVRLWLGKISVKQRRAVLEYFIMAVTSALVVPVALVCVRYFLVTSVGWSSAGYWQAVWKISESYLSIMTIALSVYYLPRLSSLQDKLKIRAEIIRTASFCAVVCFCVAVLIYFFRSLIIMILYSRDFLGAKDYFLVQLIGDFFKISSWVFAYPMIAKGEAKWYVATELIFSISFVIFSYVAINAFGVIGASIGYMINYFIYFCLMVYKTRLNYW